MNPDTIFAQDTQTARVIPLYSPPARPAQPPEPVTRRHTPFPLDALPDVMRAIVAAGAAASNTPVSLTGPLALAASSIAIGAGLELDCGGSLSCRGNLHILGVAESGTGKSEAAKVILAAINEEQAVQLAQWEKEARPSHVARALLLKKKEKTEKNHADLASIVKDRELEELKASEKGRPLLYIANATRESLAAAMALSPNQAFAVVNPDARGLIGIISGKYTGGNATDEDIYLMGFSGDAIPSLRVGSGFVNLSRPCLATCLLIQPDAFDSLRRKSIFAESGWLQRNLLFDSHANFAPLPAVPSAVPSSIAGNWRDYLRTLIENLRGANVPAVVTPSLAARALMLSRTNEIRARIEKGDLKDFASFACRWAEQANRLALNLHAALYPQPEAAAAAPLEESTLARAWRLADWFAGEQVRLLAGMRAERQHDRLERLLLILARQGKEKQLPRWKLKDNGFEEEEILSLAAGYPSRLEVGDTPSGSAGGRPPKWVRAL